MFHMSYSLHADEDDMYSLAERELFVDVGYTKIVICPKCRAYINLKVGTLCFNCGYMYSIKDLNRERKRRKLSRSLSTKKILTKEKDEEEKDKEFEKQNNGGFK